MTARCTGRSSGRCTGRCCSADQRPQTRDHRQQTRDNRPERWIMAEIAWHVFAKPGAVRRPIQDRIAAIADQLRRSPEAVAALAHAMQVSR